MPMAETTLPPSGRRILAHLQEQWADRLHLTTVAQAQARLNLPPEPDVRRSLGRYFFTHPNVHPAVARWGGPTFALTEDEKLLGRYLTARATDGRGHCALDEILAALDRPRGDVEAGLRTLAALELLGWKQDGDTVDYRLAPDLHRRLGPLGWTFHTVEVESEGRFNVP